MIGVVCVAELLYIGVGDSIWVNDIGEAPGALDDVGIEEAFSELFELWIAVALISSFHFDVISV